MRIRKIERIRPEELRARAGVANMSENIENQARGTKGKARCGKHK